MNTSNNNMLFNIYKVTITSLTSYLFFKPDENVIATVLEKVNGHDNV